MLVTVVAAGPTKPPSGTIIPSPKDSTSPVPTQPLPSAAPQGRPAPSTTLGLLQVATSKTINTTVENKTIPFVESESATVSTTEKTAADKLLSPVKSVNGHPASNGKDVLPPLEKDRNNLHEAEVKESLDKIGQKVRERDSNRRFPAQKIQKEIVLVDEVKTDSVGNPSMQRASNLQVAPPSFGQLPPKKNRVQNVEKTALGVHERKTKTNANAERVWADFTNLMKNYTSVINKANKKESEATSPNNTFEPIRLVGKKIIPKHADRSFTIQSRIDRKIVPFPVEFPSFTKSIKPAFQPSRQFHQRFPDQNSFVPSRPPSLAAPFIHLEKEDIHKTITSKNTEEKEILPKNVTISQFPDPIFFVTSRPPALATPFIQLKKDDLHKTMTSNNTEAQEILPKNIHRTIGNKKPSAINSNASTNQNETAMSLKKEMSELSEMTVTSPSRKIIESSKSSSNAKDSRAPSKIQQSSTQASFSSRIKTLEGNKELQKIEQSRNRTRVAINNNKPGSTNALKTEHPTLSSDKLSQSTNTTSRLALRIPSSQSKLPSRASEISWSNIITQKPAHSNDKVSIVKDIVAKEEKKEPSKVSTKIDPTKPIIEKKYAPSATLKNTVINQEQKPVALQLEPVPNLQPGGSDKINNTFEIDRLNFKSPTAIRARRKKTPEHDEGDSMVAASQVSITELALERAHPFRRHRILGWSPKVQQVLSNLDVKAHQVVTVTNEELNEILRFAPSSVKLRNFDTLNSAEKKLVMQNLEEAENNDFREVPRQPELFEDDVSTRLIRQRTSQRRPSVNSEAPRKSGPTKHTDDFKDSGVFDVNTSDYIKISGENDFLKFAQSDSFFENLKDTPNKPVRPLHLQADQKFFNSDMRVTRLSPVQVMRNFGNDDNFDG